MASRPLIRIPQMRPSVGADARPGDIDDLLAFIQAHPRLLVLTGAGLSTSSGIPAYRDGDGRWLRRDPILYQDFIASPAMRRRYWARSFFGWRLMRDAQPNAAHHALVGLERAGRVSLLITQNVDRLHQRAGSRRLVELHGRLDRVSCLSCGMALPRVELQHCLEQLNPDWQPEVLGYNPDGDAELEASAYPGFRTADCARCGGPLKPDVVFFGESVPARRVERVKSALARSEALLVLGSSLVVMSGYRIVRAAANASLPVVAVNQGRTRADEMLDFKLNMDCVAALQQLAAAG